MAKQIQRARPPYPAPDFLYVRQAVRGKESAVLPSVINDTVFREYKAIETLRSHGLEPVRKLLFCGPPGCGKTLAAEVIANELSLPLAELQLSGVISSFMGETASKLAKVFAYITDTPVVLLLDEFDAVASDRGLTGDVGEARRTTNALLQMMDSSKGDGIIIATTNYESLLDKAIWRRFDTIVRFDLPDAESRTHFLEMKLPKPRRGFAAGAVEYLFAGRSYADIERIINRAIKVMVLSGGATVLSSYDIEKSILADGAGNYGETP